MGDMDYGHMMVVIKMSEIVDIMGEIVTTRRIESGKIIPEEDTRIITGSADNYNKEIGERVNNRSRIRQSLGMR